MYSILNFSILYPYLIKPHYFSDNNVYRLKKGLMDERKAPKQVTIHTDFSNIVDEFYVQNDLCTCQHIQS